MANYSLADLIPESHRFTDTDGTIYDVPTGEMFSTTQLKKIAQMERDLPEVLAAWKESSGTSEAVLQLDQLVSSFFHMLVPDMPVERIDAIPIARKVHFIQWWREQEGAKAPQLPPATAGQRVRRGRRSPASPSLATTP
jgi:hypothetical protein